MKQFTFGINEINTISFDTHTVEIHVNIVEMILDNLQKINLDEWKILKFSDAISFYSYRKQIDNFIYSFFFLNNDDFVLKDRFIIICDSPELQLEKMIRLTWEQSETSDDIINRILSQQVILNDYAKNKKLETETIFCSKNLI